MVKFGAVQVRAIELMRSVAIALAVLLVKWARPCVGRVSLAGAARRLLSEAVAVGLAGGDPAGIRRWIGPGGEATRLAERLDQTAVDQDPAGAGAEEFSVDHRIPVVAAGQAERDWAI
jgi:hypothetical protein